MTRTRTIKEERYVLIWIPRTCGYDMGVRYDIPEKIFYDEPYTSEETAEMLLTLAKKEHKKTLIRLGQVSQSERIIGKYWKKRWNATKAPYGCPGAFINYLQFGY